MTRVHDSKVPASRRRRRLGAGAATLAAAALLTGSLGWASPGGAQADESFATGEFGSDVVVNNSTCWRGFGFTLNEDISVSGLTGGASRTGSGQEIYVAIYEATADDPVTEVTITELVASVTIPDSTQETVPLPSPVTLSAGTLYVLAGGAQLDEASGSWAQVEDFDSASIPGPSNLIASWLPTGEDSARALNLGNGRTTGECEGAPSDFDEAVVNINNTTTRIPAIGFTYGPVPEPTTTTTTAPAPTTTSTTVAPAPDPVTPKFTG